LATCEKSMKALSSSVAALMALVGCAALALLALRFPTGTVAQCALLTTYLALGTSSLLAIGETTSSRVTWAGFAGFGWSYLWLTYYFDVSWSRPFPPERPLLEYQQLIVDKAVIYDGLLGGSYPTIVRSVCAVTFAFAGAVIGRTMRVYNRAALGSDRGRP